MMVFVWVFCVSRPLLLCMHMVVYTQSPSVPACLFPFLLSLQPLSGCTSLLACTEDVGFMSFLGASYRYLNSLPGVLHTRTFTVAISVCCTLHIIQCMYVHTLYYLQTMYALLYILYAVFSRCVRYQAN